MGVKEWLNTVEQYMGRKSRPWKQRFIARMYANDATEELALGVSAILVDVDATRIQSVFDQ